MIELRPLTEQERAIVAGSRELIARPDGWTRDVYARDDNGGAVVTESPSAVRFCALGAMCRVSGSDEFSLRSLLLTLERLIVVALPDLRDDVLDRPVRSLTVLNDRHGLGPVLALLDYALEHGVPT